jgi:hypothetical protein
MGLAVLGLTCRVHSNNQTANCVEINPDPQPNQEATDRLLSDTKAKNPRLYQEYTALLESEKKLEELAKSFERQSGAAPNKQRRRQLLSSGGGSGDSEPGGLGQQMQRRRLMQAGGGEKAAPQAPAPAAQREGGAPGVEFDASKQGLSQEALDSFDLFKDTEGLTAGINGHASARGAPRAHPARAAASAGQTVELTEDGRPLIEAIKKPAEVLSSDPDAVDEFGEPLDASEAEGGDGEEGSEADGDGEAGSEADGDGEAGEETSADFGADEMMGADTDWGWRDETFGQVRRESVCLSGCVGGCNLD